MNTLNNAERWLIWFAAGTLAAAAIAWVAFQIQQEGIAPAVLFPMFVGAALGAALAAVGHVVRLPGRRAAAIGAVCFGLLAVVAQDYIGYRYRMRAFDDKLAEQSPLAAIAAGGTDLRPTFADHLADKLRSRPVWWTVDLLLTAAAAGAVLMLWTRRGTDAKPSPLAGDDPVRETEGK